MLLICLFGINRELTLIYYYFHHLNYYYIDFKMTRFSTSLIAWYEHHQRELPWRDSKDPYLIWISEIILQQTRVAQGYDYFVRFINRFPDLTSLAEASEDEVLKFWQGLGYYSRARNLYRAAKSMNGTFPTTYDGVLALKGVGEYTAAAICSFAYDMPHAVVDGNVYRVLARYLGIDTPIDSTSGKKIFAHLADELLDKANPAIHNQAIMDFGALQCTPKSPHCSSCPLCESCFAYAKGIIDSLPVKSTKIKVSNRYLNYFYVKQGDFIYLHKRIGNDIWKNLYELPLIETLEPTDENELIRLEPFQKLFGGYSSLSFRLLSKNIKHVLSHRILYANFYEITLPENEQILPDNLKISTAEIEQYAVPKLIHLFLEKYM